MDRGIIFSPAMVRALRPGLPAYDDNRKTQTRRLATSPLANCQPGDVLWVRENCRAVELKDGADVICYPADQTWQNIRNSPEGAEDWMKLHHYGQRKGKPAVRGKVVPSIHMPRWASRMTLFVREVRIEPLQQISDADAIAEGIEVLCHSDRIATKGKPVFRNYGLPPEERRLGDLSARYSYRTLWSSLHTERGERWEDNPDVLVLTFSVIPTSISEFAHD